MKISEVAARSGVPASTLRYYEHLGLLTAARSGNGYRNFDDSHLERLGFIDAAKQLGLELTEIRHLLELADTGTCTGVKSVLQPLLAEQITAVEHQRDSLARLSRHLHEAHHHVAACPDSSERCRSECAFRVLTRTAGQDTGSDRIQRWRALLGRGTVTSGNQRLRITLPAEQTGEAMALVQAEHAAQPTASYTLEVDAATCTLTIASADLGSAVGL